MRSQLPPILRSVPSRLLNGLIYFGKQFGAFIGRFKLRRPSWSFIESKWWDFLNQNIIILLIGGGIFQWIAWGYQRSEDRRKQQDVYRSSIKELGIEIAFRFQHLQEELAHIGTLTPDSKFGTRS
jgi:hypothetical protein